MKRQLFNARDAIGAINAEHPELDTPQAYFTNSCLGGIANQCKSQLQDIGFAPGSAALLLLSRSHLVLCTAAAVWSEGGYIICVDPLDAPERIRKLCEIAKPAVIIVDAQTVSMVPVDGNYEIVDAGRANRVPGTHRGIAIEVPDYGVAYGCFTSGSTGLPKIVGVQWSGIENYIRHVADCYLQRHGRALTAVSSSLAFDGTITTTWGGLFNDACVVFFKDSTGLFDLTAFLECAHPIALLKITPTNLDQVTNAMVKPCLQDLDIVIGGEAISSAQLLNWHDKFPNATLYNEYGPTETVVGCLVKAMSGADTEVTVGTAIAGARVRLIGLPVSRNGARELEIAGVGVAMGYIGNPRTTARKFVPDPMGSGTRAYRSGDLLRNVRKDELVYVGRMDRQIKIKGHRVELGEVEHVARSDVGITFARAFLDGEGSLAMEVTLTDGQSLSAVRKRLFRQLPHYMIPRLVESADVSTSASGKRIGTLA